MEFEIIINKFKALDLVQLKKIQHFMISLINNKN